MIILWLPTRFLGVLAPGSGLSEGGKWLFFGSPLGSGGSRRHGSEVVGTGETPALTLGTQINARATAYFIKPDTRHRGSRAEHKE